MILRTSPCFGKQQSAGSCETLVVVAKATLIEQRLRWYVYWLCREEIELLRDVAAEIEAEAAQCVHDLQEKIQELEQAQNAVQVARKKYEEAASKAHNEVDKLRSVPDPQAKIHDLKVRKKRFIKGVELFNFLTLTKV